MTAPTTCAMPKITLDQRAPSRHDRAPATAIRSSAVVTLASCRIRIVGGLREPPGECGWRLAMIGYGPHDERSGVVAINSIHVTVSTICRISFACTQGRIETE